MSDAAEVAELIAETGNTVWIGVDDDASDDETQSVTAIVDEDYSSIRRKFPEDVTSMSGRLALFYVSEADYQKIGRGEVLVYDGLKWTQLQTRSEQANNVVTMRILLCSTGGTL